MNTHRYCVDGRFVGTGQQPVCLYDNSGNYSVFDPTISGNTTSDNVVFNYDNTGKVISGVIGTVTGVRVPPNVAVIGKTGPTDIKTLVTVGGEYLRDVTDVLYNAYGMVKFTGGLTNLNNISYSAPQSWDSFKQSCHNRSVTAQMCQQFGKPGITTDYNDDVQINNNFTTNPVLYSDRWIIYLLMAIFGVIILAIVIFSGYKYSSKRSELYYKKEQLENYNTTQQSKRFYMKDNEKYSNIEQQPQPLIESSEPVEYTTLSLPKAVIPKTKIPAETPPIYIEDF